MNDYNVFLMTIATEAFQNPAHETAQILRAIADRLDTVNTRGDYTDTRGGWIGHYQTIHDHHGNDVGRFAFKRSKDG